MKWAEVGWTRLVWWISLTGALHNTTVIHLGINLSALHLWFQGRELIKKRMLRNINSAGHREYKQKFCTVYHSHHVIKPLIASQVLDQWLNDRFVLSHVWSADLKMNAEIPAFSDPDGSWEVFICCWTWRGWLSESYSPDNAVQSPLSEAVDVQSLSLHCDTRFWKM